MSASEFDAWYMARALDLARQAQGAVEPNPMVGCTIVAGDQIVGEGWHQRFGQPHAEVEALRVAGPRARGATLYVTLEPCCHHGKTPPCTQAILRSGVRRVVAALADPFPQVAGQGLDELRAAGIEVSLGPLADEAARLNAPYLKLVRHARPWVIAKWAMTLDGKIATRSGESRWISSESSRAVVHRLRGRMDAILIGALSAQIDDPLLTARPPGMRIATRVVLDTRALLPSGSQLVQTAAEVPTLVAVGEQAPAADVERLRNAGCEVLVCPGEDHASRLDWLLLEMGRRRWTNVLVEGGGKLLGSLFDAGQIDEVHAFIAPRLFGGADAPGPLGGHGSVLVSAAGQLADVQVETTGGDVYLHGRIARGDSRGSLASTIDSMNAPANRLMDVDPLPTGRPDQKPPRSLADKFRSAFRGLARGVRLEWNFRIHGPMALAVIVCGFAFGVSVIEWCVLLLCIAAVLAAELLNTALELLARTITRDFHADIKVALDISSAAVLVASIGAAAAGSVIFIRRLGTLLGWW